ncbi:Variable surface protein Vir7-like protein [Plasmodium coatneyi]|uniref:Variable surface protein Vir7-like protein n=1 Tax=Plasmodium coatneyi TaxID=208452 RepID=A0A1B1DTL0_9APIC|nr:Variable surface protein Vir7-like protein [Plasmodium coatneyi]ANQ06121.1 Variable surface protein Vir7-like protein [Plasmodium coatneyi]
MKEYKQEDLNKLPSYNHFYKKFNDGCGKCDGYPGLEDLKNNLSGHTTIAEHTVEAVSAYCCISSMTEQDNLYEERWNFFYYWIGDLLFKNPENVDMVPTTLNLICKYMNINHKEEGCEIICDSTIEKDEINHRKTIFDYWQDYNDLHVLLQDSGSNCDQQYGKYLEKVGSAYRKVYEFCRSRGSDPYCSEFNSKCNQYGTNGQLKLKCAPAQASDRIEPAERSQSMDDTASSEGSSSTIPAISGTLATIGIGTAITALLYKYTSLPSLLRTHFGGGSKSNNINTRNRRGKRSIEHHFDAFTEDDTLTVDYSTVAESTISDSIAESTTADASTLYNEEGAPPGRKGRTNNGRRPGNRDSNISYSSM